jgi:hypothetical protein
MELDPIRIWRKITDIVIKRCFSKDHARVPAFLITADPDTLCINPDFAKWFKSNYINDSAEVWAAIITHEELHRVLIELGNADPDTEAIYDCVDSIAPNIRRSMFFVDGDWQWLK